MRDRRSGSTASRRAISDMSGWERDEDYWTRPEIVEDFETRQPYPRMGTPEDCAYAALYLASDESAFVTGSNLVLDGGMTIAEILAGGRG